MEEEMGDEQLRATQQQTVQLVSVVCSNTLSSSARLAAQKRHTVVE